MKTNNLKSDQADIIKLKLEGLGSFRLLKNTASDINILVDSDKAHNNVCLDISENIDYSIWNYIRKNIWESVDNVVHTGIRNKIISNIWKSINRKIKDILK